MAGPIYKLFLAKYKESWYKLTKAEQDKLVQQDIENLKQLGVEGIIFCDSSWASEEWPGWGVEKYPDIEAVQKHAEFLNSLNWFEYIESISYLGTAMTLP